MGKFLDKIILYSWPVIFCVTMVGSFIGCELLLFFVTWTVLGAGGYDYGDHPTGSSGIGIAAFYMAIIIATIVLGIIFVALISLFKYLLHTNRGYWNCFRGVYSSCVRFAWILILPLMIIDVILAFTIG